MHILKFYTEIAIYIEIDKPLCTVSNRLSLVLFIYLDQLLDRFFTVKIIEKIYLELRMNTLHMKHLTQAQLKQAVICKMPSPSDADATNKLSNYAGQFHAKYALLKQNSLVAV